MAQKVEDVRRRLTEGLSETREGKQVGAGVTFCEVLPCPVAHERGVDVLIDTERLEIQSSRTLADKDELGQRGRGREEGGEMGVSVEEEQEVLLPRSGSREETSVREEVRL